jgi:hypothetical protein
MTTDNLANFNPFYHTLIDDRSTSIANWIRCTLDPRLMHGFKIGNFDYDTIDCPLVDNHNAFMPVLTSNIISVTGFPDKVITPFVSKPGNYKETYVQGDGPLYDYKEREVSVTFRNFQGNIIMRLFDVWVDYIRCVFEGVLSPYPDYLMADWIDYQTRIYRIILDPTQTYVIDIMAFPVSFPITVPRGASGDFNIEKPFIESKDVTIMFISSGVCYNSGMLAHEFNKAVCIFNSSMKDGNRETYNKKLNKFSSKFFSWRGYPRINPNNYELEWWVPNDLYNIRSQYFLNLENINNKVASAEPLLTGD